MGGRNRHGQLGLGHVMSDQSRPKLVTLPDEVAAVIDLAVTSNSSVILCRLKNGKKAAYACGLLRGTRMWGYTVDYNDDYMKSASSNSSFYSYITQFSRIDVDLHMNVSSVTATGGQLVFQTSMNANSHLGEDSQVLLNVDLN